MKRKNFQNEREAFEECLAKARVYINKITALRGIDPEKIEPDYVSYEIDSAADAFKSALKSYRRTMYCTAREAKVELGRLSPGMDKETSKSVYKNLFDSQRTAARLELDFLGFQAYASKEIDVLVNKVALLFGEAGYSEHSQAAMDAAVTSIGRAAKIVSMYNVKGFDIETDARVLEVEEIKRRMDAGESPLSYK
jgi:hypothetical protein